MKIREGFILRNIADSWIVVPTGQGVVEFNCLITLSESGALLWKKLESGANIEELATALLREYEIDESVARLDALKFVLTVHEKGLIEIENVQ